MPPTPPNQKAGDLHEEYLADVFGGRKTKASGSQWHDQGDGHNYHDDPFAFFWDGKSTKGKQLAFTRADIDKLREQSQGMRMAFGARWYANENLSEVAEDWGLLPAEDIRELLESARKLAALEAENGDLAVLIPGLREEIESLRGDMASTEVHLENAGSAGDAALQEIARWRSAAEVASERVRELEEQVRDGRIIPQYVPSVPWTVLHQVHIDGRTETSGVYYGPDYSMTQVEVREMRVERHRGNRPRIIVNNTWVPWGDLYINGMLAHRAWLENPGAEVG